MTQETCKQVLLKIPFKDEAQASLVSEILNVDKELKGCGVTRKIRVEGNILLVHFEGILYKKLRVSSNALLKNILLIVKTLDLFP